MTPTVMVFVARGCGACHAFVPVLRQVGRPHARHVKVQLIEISSPGGQQMATAHRIRATPTTIVQSRSGKHYRRVGALPADQLAALFQAAQR